MRVAEREQALVRAAMLDMRFGASVSQGRTLKNDANNNSSRAQLPAAEFSSSSSRRNPASDEDRVKHANVGQLAVQATIVKTVADHKFVRTCVKGQSGGQKAALGRFCCAHMKPLYSGTSVFFRRSTLSSSETIAQLVAPRASTCARNFSSVRPVSTISSTKSTHLPATSVVIALMTTSPLEVVPLP